MSCELHVLTVVHRHYNDAGHRLPEGFFQCWDVGGGILLAHSYIQNNLPEGFAVPETRQELAVVLWNMASKPEPASQQTYTDVQDEEVLKAVCWAVENELVTPETESTLGADVRVNRLQVIGAMYQTNKRKK